MTDDDRSGRPWSPEETSYLRWAYSQGQSLGHIARHLGRTTASVKQRAYRLGLPTHPRFHSRELATRRDDVATRLAVLLGQEVRPPSGRRLFSDEELLRFAGRGLEGEEMAAWRETTWDGVKTWLVDPPLRLRDGEDAAWARLHGLDTLCREALHLELMDHQLAMALCCLASKRAVCLAGRQSGKDYTQAALALWEAVVQPNARLVLVSAAQRQSDELASKLLGFVARHDRLFDSVLRSSREQVEFTNGSLVHALPASGLIRGLTATRVLVNEARDVLDEEETYSAVEPMLLTTGGSLAIFTTPFGRQGRVWEAFHSPLYLKTRIPSTASRYASEEHLESQRLEMSAALYACEYEAQFLDVQDSYFSIESIARCTRDYDLRLVAEEGETTSLGIDWARTRDTSTMVVVGRDEEDLLHVRAIRSFLGTPMPDQVAYVHHLHSVFRFRRIVSEYAGLGIGPTDQLVQDLGGRHVEAFRPSTERKALAYDALKTRLEKASIVLPNHPKMLQELRSLAFRLTPSGAMTIHHPGGGSDDYADALMLASWAFRPQGTRKSRVRSIPRARPPWGC